MTRCPGCGLELPTDAAAPVPVTRYRTAPECMALFGELVASATSDYGWLKRWHQVCVDAYGAQHTGPDTAPITTAFALNGLYLVLERGLTGIQAREAHGYLANTVDAWPRFPPPDSVGGFTVFDVAIAGAPDERVAALQRWGRVAWDAWSHVHAEVREMTDRQLRGWYPRTS